MKTWPTKDPDELLDFGYDWAPDLNDGETLVSHVLTVLEAAGTTVEAEAITANEAGTAAKAVTAWISGGTDGQSARFELRVTTSEDRIFEDTIILPIASVIAPVPYPGGYAEPTAANLIFVYPEFAAVPKERIDYYLERAGRAVDTSWTQGDFGHARMLLAAHLMTLSGIGDTAEARSVASGASQFKSIRSGSLSLERAGDGSGGAFAATRYGREFKQLRFANRGGPRVTNAVAIGGGGDGDHFGPWTQ